MLKPGILSGGSQVADGFRVAAALGDGGLGGVVRRVVVEVGDGADQVIGEAHPRHAHLLTGHELQGTVGAKVQHRIGPPDFVQEGVVGGKAVVGAGGAGEQQPHGVAFVAEGGLHANEHVAEGLTVHQHILAVGVEVAGGWSPVFPPGAWRRG